MSISHSFQHEHLGKLARLLQLESLAEAEKLQQDLASASPVTAEARGDSLIRLAIRDETGGLGGRLLLTLGKRNPQEPLPWTRLRVGSPVQLSSEDSQADAHWRGVVSRLRRGSIEVAFDHWPEDLDGEASLRLDLAPDEISRRRMQEALTKVDSAKENRLSELRDILLGHAEPLFTQTNSVPTLNLSLNPPQLDAIQNALDAQDVAIIHGPPGTGKTTAVVELIGQAVARGEQVLACAPSNLAVDNIFERLLAAPEFANDSSVVRIGHPARVLPRLREQTLEVLVDDHPDMKVIRKLTKDAIALRNQAGRYTRAKPAPGQRKAMRDEAKAMLTDARRMERQLVERVLDGAKVICATTTGVDERLLGLRTFDLCVIDEAGQSVEPGCWIPLLRSQRVVLAGDHCQLPPTVVSQEATRQGLGISLLERLMNEEAENKGGGSEAVGIARQLTVQYRMHKEIMNFSSAAFYHSTLLADDSVKDHLLCDVPNVTETALTASPVHFIDTAGADYSEEEEPDGESRFNPQEALLVQRKVTQLLEAGLSPLDMAIIAPYSAQVRHLREALGNEVEAGVEVGSIDGFQGREKEAIIITLVRSNSDGQIGFLADTRRMNVALTRARRGLIVIGDSATIGGHPFYGQLLDYFEQINAYHTIWEEQ
ncbi:MAG: AAA domain-containing protein [Chloroflexota bacterium]